MNIWAFGDNQYCQLNREITEIPRSEKPLKIEFFSNKKVKKMVTGRLHNFVLCEDNELYGWGINDEYALEEYFLEEYYDLVRKIPFKYEIEDIVAGASHTAILTKDGHVYLCGTFRDKSGVFGFDEKNKFGLKFKKVPNLNKIVSIGSGASHVTAIDRMGDIWTLGTNAHLQLGRRGSRRRVQRKSILKPAVITSSHSRKNKKFIKTTGSDFSTFAINEKNEAYGWGRNIMGELGHSKDGCFIEKSKFGIENVVDIQSGVEHTMILTGDKELYACGSNVEYQCGNVDSEHIHTPVKVAEGVDRVRCGDFFTVYQRGNDLYCTGSNANCEMGVKGVDSVKQFTKIDFDFGQIDDYVCGGLFTMVHCNK